MALYSDLAVSDNVMICSTGNPMGASGSSGWLVLFVMSKMIQGSATDSSYLCVFVSISVFAHTTLFVQLHLHMNPIICMRAFSSFPMHFAAFHAVFTSI